MLKELIFYEHIEHISYIVIFLFIVLRSRSIIKFKLVLLKGKIIRTQNWSILSCK